MSVSGIKIESKGTFEVPLYKMGVYQMQLVDVQAVTGKDPVSGLPKEQLQMDFQFVEPSSNYLGNNYRHWVTLSWFTRNESKAKPQFSESALFTMIDAMFSGYEKNRDANNVKKEEVTDDLINSMVGRQWKFMIGEKVTKSGQKRNKVLSISPIEKHVEYTPIAKTISEDQEKKDIEEFDKFVNDSSNLPV